MPASKKDKVNVPAFTEPSFEEVEVPVVSQVSSVANPFANKVAELVANWADKRSAKAVAVVVPNVSLDRCQRQISQAGKDLSKSMRQIKEPAGAGNTKITFWAVDQITRPRKAKETEAVTETPSS